MTNPQNQSNKEWDDGFGETKTTKTIQEEGSKSVQKFLHAGGLNNTPRKNKPPTATKLKKEIEIVDGYTRNSEGKIKASKQNLVEALSNPSHCGVDICLDNFKGEIVLSEPNLKQWRSLKETDATEICIRLETGISGFADISKDRWRESVNLTAQYHQIDTAQVWINSLKWDGIRRIETFLPRYLGTADTPYTRAIGIYMWTALAGRVLSAGCKVDMIPVLMGDQGTGKSETIKALVPDYTFYAEFDLKNKDDDQARMMRGVLVGEIAELNGLRGRDSEAVKAFITRTVDSYIPKFMEYKVEFPRRLVFFGTTNDDEFLTDSTGNRRWLPFKVGRCNIDKIKVDREQLWSEGMARYIASGVAWQEAEELAQNEHKAFIETDSWDTPVINWLDAKAENGIHSNKDRSFTMHEVLASAINKSSDKSERKDEMRMGKILKRLGFKKMRRSIKGKQTTHWISEA